MKFCLKLNLLIIKLSGVAFNSEHRGFFTHSGVVSGDKRDTYIAFWGLTECNGNSNGRAKDINGNSSRLETFTEALVLAVLRRKRC